MILLRMISGLLRSTLPDALPGVTTDGRND